MLYDHHVRSRVSPALAALVASCGSFDGTSHTDGGIDAPPPSPSRTGLVLAFDFDEPSGDSRVVDSSGSGNDGALFIAQRVAGVQGSALSFSAGYPAGYVTVPGAPSTAFATASDLTVAFWAFLEEPPVGDTEDYVLVYKAWTDGAADPPFVQFSAELDASLTKTLRLFVGLPDGSRSFVAVAPRFGEWMHATFVLKEGEMLGYVDGVKRGLGSMRVNLSQRASELRVGADTQSKQPFHGKIDALRIYARALADEEIVVLATR